MNLILLMVGLTLSEVGILSLMVAAAYRANTGAGVAALTGLSLVLIGLNSLIKTRRRYLGKNALNRGSRL